MTSLPTVGLKSVPAQMFRYLSPDGRGWKGAGLGCVKSEDMLTAFLRHLLSYMSCMGGTAALVMCCAFLPQSIPYKLPMHSFHMLL